MCGRLEITSKFIIQFLPCSPGLLIASNSFWVPMLCPFIGGTFGGFLYDALIFTGESPINTPWMGLKRLVRPSKKGAKQATTTSKPEKAV